MVYSEFRLPGVRPIHIQVIDKDVNGYILGRTQYASEDCIPECPKHAHSRDLLYWYSELDMSFDSPLDPDANKAYDVKGILSRLETLSE